MLMSRHLRLASLAFGMSVAITSGVYAADTWTADVFDVVNGKFVPGTYTSISTNDVTKAWRICVLYPHLKDDYWLGHDYGIVEEAKRDHVSVQVYEAGGYTNLATQLNQFDNCVVQKFDAILIAAISADGVSAAVKKAVGQGIIVIDYPNGINEPSISGHARVPFYNMGHAAGEVRCQDRGQICSDRRIPARAGGCGLLRRNSNWFQRGYRQLECQDCCDAAWRSFGKCAA